MGKLELQDFEWFSHLTEAEITALSAAMVARHFDQGQLIISYDDASHDVYFVLQGVAIAAYWTDEGKEIAYAHIGAGEQFGELSALDGQPRSLSIYAKVSTDTLVLPEKMLHDLIDRDPVFRQKILSDLVGRVRDLTRRINDLTSLSVTDRVRGLLVRLALESQVFVPNGQLTDPPTHAEIGNYVGANREAVSRVLSQLNRDGVIASGRQSITLVRPEALLVGEG
jgi:CRP/FNR family cyclic AMP-dependent transcriptional regulator